MNQLLEDNEVCHLEFDQRQSILFQMSYGQFTALILTPTRELAVQIKSHIQLACRYTKFKVRDEQSRPINREKSFQTAVVVGGMSTQKQERLLAQKPEIIVATPGRLWELVQEVNSFDSIDSFS